MPGLCAPGARACRRRPSAAAPGRTRTGRGPATAGRRGSSAPACAPARPAPRRADRRRRSPSAAAAERGKDPPNTDIAFTSPRSCGSSASSRAASSELRLAGTSSSPSSPSRNSRPLRSFSTPRSASALTVSSAYSGTPSARCDDPRRGALGQAVDEAVEQPAHRCVVERLERERRRAAPAGGPSGPSRRKLRAGQREDEDRTRGRPVEQRAR